MQKTFSRRRYPPPSPSPASAPLHLACHDSYRTWRLGVPLTWLSSADVETGAGVAGGNCQRERSAQRSDSVANKFAHSACFKHAAKDS